MADVLVRDPRPHSRRGAPRVSELLVRARFEVSKASVGTKSPST